FNLGRFVKNNSLGKITTKVNANGKGFSLQNIDTKVDGDISSFTFNGYTYRNILVDADLNRPNINGQIHIDDPNIKLSLVGVVDLTSKVNFYDLEAQVDYAELHKIKLIERDTISVLKGNIKFDGYGNSLDEISGTLNIAS